MPSIPVASALYGNYPHFKLPHINMPKFSGNILQWGSFRDQFVDLMHKQPSLSNAQKLVYLQRVLDGEVASVIKSTNSTDADYEGAKTRWSLGTAIKRSSHAYA